MGANSKIVRSKRNCCVVGCSNNEARNPDLHFYAFPGKPWEKERKNKWIAAVRRELAQKRPWKPSRNSRVCSTHFVGGEKSNLLESDSYIPTIFPSPYKRKPNGNSKRADRAKARRSLMDDIDMVYQPEPVKLISTTETQADGHYENPVSNAGSILFCWQNTESNEAATQTSISVQQSAMNISLKVSVSQLKPKTKHSAVGSDKEMNNGSVGYQSIETDLTMKQLSGINLHFFAVLLKFIVAGTDGQPMFFRKLGRENRLLLFLMKMKLGLTFCAIGCLFNVSGVTASKIFFEILTTLLINVKSWVFWPSREAIKKTLPLKFDHYPNCRAIIDCTEIGCDRPPTVEQRVQMYSHYKGCFTVKYLVAITPTGMVSFLSKGYGGHSSDSFITNDSGFLNAIDYGDQVLADKGFPLIRSELLQRNCDLIMPPFVVTPQFTEEEVNLSYSVASVRIHVERAIQRIKIFRILNHVYAELYSRIDEIMYIACILSNNKEPLIKQPK